MNFAKWFYLALAFSGFASAAGCVAWQAIHAPTAGTVPVLAPKNPTQQTDH